MSDLQARLLLDNNRNPCCDDRPPSPLFSEPLNPQPSSIPAGNWREVERAARGIIWQIQPTKKSEERRRDVVEYVQRLIRTRLGSEVFPFGSVPLKTYLPDGDIDLTALGPPNLEENLAVNVRAILEEEEHSNVAAFEVRDVQYIHAEVKLVKCLIQNIVVDISFNQIGGLCTLCFLEQVDNLIGKDHLFKQSIILIKAWCYYESRILGAHHSLISTYALETLVLYIFHLFNSSLDGPVAVLYRFLDHFSKFDWDNFCISLRGPVSISSLPEIVAETPEANEGALLLAPEFLNRCAKMYSVPCRVSENNHRLFAKKHLNIVDPLKENNNLGRSVSKGNLYRIRSAFAYGARKLGQILLLSTDRMSDELNKFFKNTLERHGNGERPDVQGNCNSFPDKGLSGINSRNGSALPRIILDKAMHENLIISQSCDSILEKSCNGLNEAKSPVSLKENGLGQELHQKSGSQDRHRLAECYLQPCNHTKNEISKDCKDLLRSCLAGDGTNILATVGKSDSRDFTDTYEPSSTCTNVDADTVTSTKINHAPHLFFHLENGKEMVASGAAEQSLNCSEVRVDIEDAETSGRGLPPDAFDLADLLGEHERNFKNLQYAQRCNDYFLNGCVSLGKPLFFPPLLNKQQWLAVSQSYIFRNGLIQSSPFSSVPNYHHMNPNLISDSYNVEDMPKPRGTGMYLTNMNYQMRRDTPTSGRGRNLFPANLGPRARSSGPPLAPAEAFPVDLSGHEPRQQAQYQINDECGSFESSHASNPLTRGFPQVKRNTSPSEGHVEIGTFGPVPLSIPSELGRSDSEDPHGSRISSPTQKPLKSPNRERSAKSYRLKDEDEFPPLSSKGHQNSNRTMWEIRK